MSFDDHKPIGEVLSGLKIYPLEEGEIAMDAHIVLKVLRADGTMAWVSRSTADMSIMEIIGVLSAELDRELHDYRTGWESDDA